MVEAWTPAQVRWVLEHLAELLLQVRPGTEHVPRARKQRRRAPPFAFRAVELVADIERALADLRRVDPTSYALLRAAYIDNPGLPRTHAITAWAADRNCSVRSAWRAHQRALARLAAILNGCTVDGGR